MRGGMARAAFKSSACIMSRARRATVIRSVLDPTKWQSFMESAVRSTDEAGMGVLFTVRPTALNTNVLPVRYCCVLKEGATLTRR